MRSLLALALIGGLLAVGLSGGCTRPVKPPGGSPGSKAEHARQNAEGLALNVVSGVANAHERFVSTTTAAAASPSSSSATIISPQGTSSTAVRPASQPASPPPPVPTSSQWAVNAGRDTPQMSATTQKPSVRPTWPAIIRERVRSSTPYTSEAEAEDDALVAAQNTIQQRLAELDPPIYYRPTLNEVKQEFVRKDSRTISEPSAAVMKEFVDHNVIEPGKRLVYVEYDLDVTANQIRELHTRDRVAILFKALAGLTCVALASFLFLRADEWTKGYLTRWLACGSVVLVGGAAAALYFI